MSEKYVIVTGGPGSGKTSLLAALRANGFAVTSDAARSIIQQRTRIGAPAMVDDESFAELILSWEMRSYSDAGDGVVFFDRGVPDVVAFYHLIGRPAPRHVYEAAERFRYHPTVFVAPPWRDIFANDAERTQTYDHAVRVYEALLRTYPGLGYDVAVLPMAPVETRVTFVRDMMGV
jgi:predicted ATPase